MIRRLLRGAAIACVVGALAHCDAVHEAVHAVKKLATLDQALVARYPNRSIGLEEGGGVLSITFRNAPEASLPPAQRAEFARGVAGFVRDHYAGYGALDTVRVGFESQQNYGPLDVTHSAEPYSYGKAELGPAATPPRDTTLHDPPAARAPRD
jgi:hypothetical protein